MKMGNNISSRLFEKLVSPSDKGLYTEGYWCRDADLAGDGFKQRRYTSAMRKTVINKRIDRRDSRPPCLGYFFVDHYKVSTCSMCYFYMIKDDPKYTLNKQVEFHNLHNAPYYLIRNVHSEIRRYARVFPSYDNQTSLDEVCATLDDESCDRWSSCCKAAWECCVLQQMMTTPLDDGLVDYCPITFDGWLCWNYSRAGIIVKQSCPDFLIDSQISGQGIKQCGADGQWLVDNLTGLEYTDYDECQQSEENNLYRWAIVVGIVLNCLGLLVCVPAIVIFTLNRGLYKQQRIQIHINLFVSIVLAAVFSIVWDVTVRLDRLLVPQEQSTLHSKQALCKSLHVLYKWGRSTTFFWMTCEGYFLHRLVVNAFLPPKHFYGYLVFGWVIPSLLIVLYAVIRRFISDDSLCWLLPLQGSTKSIEWVLVYSPSIVCIVINIVFLFNILKQLLTKLSSHPNEPSTFRKAVKATFILIPLFGIDQFCLIYRPSPEKGTEYYVYEFVSAIILNSQGIIISLVFCYFNNEVRGYISHGVSRLKQKYFNKRREQGNRKSSVSTKSDSRKTSISSLQIYATGQPQNGRPIQNGIHTQNGGQIQNSGQGIINKGFSSDAIEITSL